MRYNSTIQSKISSKKMYSININYKINNDIIEMFTWAISFFQQIL